jgi:hypothetical protein
LAKARQGHDKARELLTQDTDPSTAKREDQQAASITAANTFEAVAQEFHTLKAGGWTEGHATSTTLPSKSVDLLDMAAWRVLHGNHGFCRNRLARGFSRTAKALLGCFQTF